MYQVTITKIEEKKKVDSDYQKIADSGNAKDDGAVYGYVDHEIVETVTTELYKQKTEDLNIQAVITAVNQSQAPGTK